MGKVSETVQAKSDRNLQQSAQVFLEASSASSRQIMATLVLRPVREHSAHCHTAAKESEKHSLIEGEGIAKHNVPNHFGPNM